MNRRELLDPARLAGFVVGILAGIGCIALGMDMHRSAPPPAAQSAIR